MGIKVRSDGQWIEVGGGAVSAGQNILTQQASTPYYITASDVTSGVSTAGFIDTTIVARDGNIGIGTDAPSQTLDVNGNVRLRNALYDVNNQTGTSGQVLSSTGSGVDWVNTSDLGVDNATNVVVTDESTDTTCFPLFVTAATGTLPPKTGTNLTFNSDQGILSATEFKGNPYDAVPAYSNSDYDTIRWNTDEFAITLQSDTDTTIGMAFPAFRCNTNTGGTFKISIQIRAAATSTDGVYIRLYEYDAELPNGKTHVSNTATNPVVQEDTRIKNLSPTYENQPGNTSWQTLTFDYTPTSTAVWASVVVLNWSGLGNNALYVRDYKRESVLSSISVGDAQTLDGLDSTQFLRSDADDTASGQITFTDSIVPSVGNDTSSGINWPPNPGGGGSDQAAIRYYITSGENTTLEISNNNDASDIINLVAGSVNVGGNRILTTADGGGSYVQVLQAQNTTVTTISSGSEANVITQAITPTSTSSKILLMASVNLGMPSGATPNTRAWFRRGTTNLGSFVDGVRKGGIAGVELRDGGEDFANVAFAWLDSPSTTSSITYAIRVGTEDGEIVTNRVGSVSNAVWATRSYSVLTVMEIDS